MIVPYFICLLWIMAFLQSSGDQIRDYSYEEIESQLASLQKLSFINNMQSAKEFYALNVAEEGGVSCSPTIARITHQSSLRADRDRPQILISGEIHGDERVGPPASLLMAQLLSISADCEINRSQESCSTLVQHFNITESQRVWLTLLATRRDSFIIPTANCLGHKLRHRDDAGVDPNRDFPYSRKNNRCFMSTTSRLFEKIAENNHIQVVVTYHGGMIALGYEWGSQNHPRPNDATPDDNANRNLGSYLSQYAGKFEDNKLYPVGKINSIIYPVDGGMEDWLYAAGWDKGLVHTDCIRQPGHQGNNKLRLRQQRRSNSRRLSVKDNDLEVSGNRALVFLVETSNQKSPDVSKLGGTQQILDPSSSRNGHVPRNVRLGLMAIDMLQPYVAFSQVSLQSIVGSSNDILHLQWYVGGAVTVDKTFLMLHHAIGGFTNTADWTSYHQKLPSDSILDATLTSKMKKKLLPSVISPVLSGKGRWEMTKTDSSGDSDLITPKSSFSHSVDMSKLLPVIRKRQLSRAATNSSQHSHATSRFWIIAWAIVDQDYSGQGQGYPKDNAPMSHYSNLRTNSNWHCTPIGAEQRSCRGHRYWPSDFIEIEVSNGGSFKIMRSVQHGAWWKESSAPSQRRRLRSNQEKKSSNKSPRSEVQREQSQTAAALDFTPYFLNLSSLLTATTTSQSSPQQQQSRVGLKDHKIETEVEESYSFERTYLFFFFVLVVAVMVMWYVTSQWRRNRIYSSLINNKYLNLPTGFKHAPTIV